MPLNRREPVGRRRLRAGFFLCLILLVVPVHGEDIPLLDFLDRRDATLEWDPVVDMGRILLRGSEIRLRVGLPFVLVDQEEKLEIEPVYRDGANVMLPVETAASLSRVLDAAADTKQGSSRVAVVLIDPGHGGRDPGAIGGYAEEGESVAVREKDVVLDVAAGLKELLDQRYPNKRIELTRDSDIYVSLEERTRIANEIPLESDEAIIFISIHVNAAFNDKARGFEVWYLPPDYRRDLSDRTKAEGATEEIIPILSSMLEAEYATESVMLATDILGGLERHVGSSTENRGLKEEIWFVVRNSKMPAVLIELGFVTNSSEAQNLDSPDYLRALTQGIYTGVVRFIQRFESSKGFTQSS
jgi:N-acetylmuramoyl-L-alanine amidase